MPLRTEGFVVVFFVEKALQTKVYVYKASFAGNRSSEKVSAICLLAAE